LTLTSLTCLTTGTPNSDCEENDDDFVYGSKRYILHNKASFSCVSSVAVSAPGEAQRTRAEENQPNTPASGAGHTAAKGSASDAGNGQAGMLENTALTGRSETVQEKQTGKKVRRVCFDVYE